MTTTTTTTTTNNDKDANTNDNNDDDDRNVVIREDSTILYSPSVVTNTTTTTPTPIVNEVIQNNNNNNNNDTMTTYSYMMGYNNHFVTEVLPGAVPIGRNTPRMVPYNLYTEQLSGTAFTASPRSSHNKRSWLYRIQPTVSMYSTRTTSSTIASSTTTTTTTTASSSTNSTTMNSSTTDKVESQNYSTSCAQRLHEFFGHCNPTDCISTIDPIRWKPLNDVIQKQQQQQSSSSLAAETATTTAAAATAAAVSNGTADTSVTNDEDDDNNNKKDFIDGMQLMCHAGETTTRYGIAIYQYGNVTQSMMMKQESKYMMNTDGDFLIVPQTGTLQIDTELGRLLVSPSEIVVVPRGIIFSIHPILNTTTPIEVEDIGATGYVLEVYTSGGSSFQLPELGPIGSNGLANIRDFYYPVAWCETLKKEEYYNSKPRTLITKKDSELFRSTIHHTPYNVVGWHGNYAPYKYNLHRFCAVNSVTYDHLDPSIYTVLTCPSAHTAGVALADFVIFPSKRILATDSNTLRPPWFHRNVMSEFMGLIYGTYDAKKHGSFVPGGASLHNALTPHGPDDTSYQRAVNDPCTTPTLYEGGLAFMFETCLSLKVAPTALYDTNWRDIQYATDAWGTGLTADKFTGWQ